MCKRNDLGNLPNLPRISKNNIIPTKLEDILENNVDNKYLINGKLKISCDIWNKFLIILKENNIQIPKFPIWTDWWDSNGDNTKLTKEDKNLTREENLINIKKNQELFYNKYKNWIDKNRTFYRENENLLKNWLLDSRNIKAWVGSLRKLEWQAGNNFLLMNQVLWSPRGSGIRIKNLDYSPTLVAMASMIPIYGPLQRYLTPRECARLQSFSEEFKIHENDKVAYKQFGNAVNVKMIEQCAKFLIFNENLFD